MSQTFIVRLRGASYSNPDGTDRQHLIARCLRNSPLVLTAEPENPHDRHAVAVLDSDGHQLGYLPSDARDASSILRGEGISASVEKVIGGTRWWHKLFGIKRHYGLLIRLTKAPIDWSAHNKHREAAGVIDQLVRDALSFEKSSPSIDKAIAAYQRALAAVVELNRGTPVTAAHRYEQAPINRLTMLLVRQKRYDDARKAYEEWSSVRDPIGLTKADRNAMSKRMSKLQSENAA